MEEKHQKIFIYDRWYYQVMETRNKIYFSTTPENTSTGNSLEINKDKTGAIIKIPGNIRDAKVITLTKAPWGDSYFEFKIKQMDPISFKEKFFSKSIIKFKTKSVAGKMQRKIDLEIYDQTNEKRKEILKNFDINSKKYLEQIRITPEELEYFITITQMFGSNYFETVPALRKQDIIKQPIKSINKLKVCNSLEMLGCNFKLSDEESPYLIYRSQNQNETITLSIGLTPENDGIRNLVMYQRKKFPTTITPLQENSFELNYKGYQELKATVVVKEGKKILDQIEKDKMIYDAANFGVGRYVNYNGEELHMGDQSYFWHRSLIDLSPYIIEYVGNALFPDPSTEKKLIKDKVMNNS